MSDFSAYSGFRAASDRIESIAHNVANIKTPGFKAVSPIFSDLPYKTEGRIGEGERKLGLVQMGNGVAMVGTIANFAQGDIIEAKSSDTNIAIDGHGFFMINNTLNDTILYTRSGNFVRDSEGNMVMHNSAYQLAGEGGPITIPARATQLTIERNGNVTAKVDDEVQNLGRIRLVSFINPAGLKRLGDNVYEATEESGDPVEGYPTEDDLGSLLQGFLESSNVNMTSSLFELYQAVRASSFAQRCIEAYSESEKKLLESRSL